MGESQEELDVEATELRSQVRRRLFGTDEIVRIGRYRVERALGRGGMGIVYAAWDPQLGRRVALKVLRPRPGRRESLADRNIRLLREAKSMAQLSHPNVASVYECGAIGDRVYVAMEFIEGDTLGAWTSARSRSTADILRVFIAAGRGLSAAHQASIVHRDFKPDNVMVGPGDRVRVLDFGLARAAGGEPSLESLETLVGSGSGDGITETGTVLGTPAYMAPEQRERVATSAASDQYSYCVALHEALFGSRPATGSEPVEPPARRQVDRRVRAALSRGLSRDPAARWPTMDALLHVLASSLNTRRPWGWVAAGTLGCGLLASVVTPYSDAASQTASPCVDSGLDADRLLARAPLVAADNTASNASNYAAAARSVAHQQIKSLHQSWTQSADENCRATFIDRRQPQPAYLWRAQCLADSLQEIVAIVELLEADDPVALEHAATALAAINPAQACSEDRALRQPDQASTTVERPEVIRIREALARSAGLVAAGRYQSGYELSADELPHAESTGLKPLIAQAQLAHGRAASAAGYHVEAERAFGRAIAEGVASGDDDTVAEAWIEQLRTLGGDLGELEAAERVLAPMQGALERIGSPPILEARARQAEGTLREAQGRFPEAIALHQQALATYEAHLAPQHPRVIGALHGLAKAMRGNGDYAGSLEPARRGLALSEAVLAPEHPGLAAPLTSVGTALGATGDHSGALLHFERAAEILEAALGTRHSRLGAAMHNVGSALIALRRYDEAVDALRLANEIDEVALGPDHPYRASSLYALAMAYRYRGEYDQAEASLDVALEILTRAWGDEHPDLAYVLVGLGNVSAGQKNYRAAIGHFDRVREILSATLGARHPRIVHATIGAALAHAELGEHDNAIVLLEEAISISTESPGDPLEVAEAKFELARALSARGKQLERAKSLAAEARPAFAGLGDAGRAMVERIDAWNVSMGLGA